MFEDSLDYRMSLSKTKPTTTKQGLVTILFLGRDMTKATYKRSISLGAGLQF